MKAKVVEAKTLANFNYLLELCLNQGYKPQGSLQVTRLPVDYPRFDFGAPAMMEDVTYSQLVIKDE